MHSHYLTPQGAAEVQAAIAAHRAKIAELRSQRPFRDFGRKVVSLAAYRANPLLQKSAA